MAVTQGEEMEVTQGEEMTQKRQAIKEIEKEKRKQASHNHHCITHYHGHKCGGESHGGSGNR